MKRYLILLILPFCFIWASQGDLKEKEVLEVCYEEKVSEMTVTATCYFPVPSQTDDTPYLTADMSKINPKYPHKHRWVAVSRDLLETYKMGDTIKVSGTWVYDGYWIIHDKMNKRYKKTIDFLVSEDMYTDKWENVCVERK